MALWAIGAKFRENAVGLWRRRMDEIFWKEIFSSVGRETSLEDYLGKDGNILVIAPHPDDDVLGVGGTMAAATHQGKGVFAVYITDGRGSPRMDHTISDDEMAALRKKKPCLL